MEIKVVFYHVFHQIDPKVFPEKIEFIANYDENTTISELFDKAGQPCADLSEYYYLSGKFSFNERYVPYIIKSEGNAEWNVPFDKVRVIDFIYTHGINNNAIVAKTGYPQAGGPGFKELSEIWTNIYPIIDQIVTVVGLGSILVAAGKWINSKFKSKEVPPQSYFDLIFSRREWNHFELAELIEISKDDAKKLLQIFGYKYDRSMRMYVQQNISLELREKLSKTNVLDI